MAKDTKKKKVGDVKKMARIIFFKKTDKAFVYKFGEGLMEYEKAVEKAKGITK